MDGEIKNKYHFKLLKIVEMLKCKNNKTHTGLHNVDYKHQRRSKEMEKCAMFTDWRTQSNKDVNSP